jgi:AraC family transcriptional regulator, transcriptional activator of pobA
MGGQSSAPLLHRAQLTGRRTADGAPIMTYKREPGLPPVGVSRFSATTRPAGRTPGGSPHAHDFLLLNYFAAGGGSIRVNRRDWSVRTGDAFVVGPGDQIATGDGDGLAGTEGWCVYFPPDVLTPAATGPSWRSHPLLFPFTAGGTAVRRLHVPEPDRRGWNDRFDALEAELTGRRAGYPQAALAHLTLLLVGVSRLAADVAGDLRSNDEPLLAGVFDVIETRYREPLSLRDVAAAVGLTPGHLTTTVARKTGRTVQQWITERRMAEARHLLTDTDLTIQAVATRTGFRDPAYFVRTFRRDHGTTPTAWRRPG